MVGICLIAALIVSAVGAGSASAAKSKYSAETWGQYKYCPYEDPEVTFCYAGITSGGAKGGFFQLGSVAVKLNKPVTLQGGLHYPPESEVPFVTPAANGGETLESPELKIQGGLSVLTKQIQEASGWPEALKQSFKEAKKNKEGTATVKIEVAGGNLLYETQGALSLENLILEEGDAFKLPLKVKVSSPWLTKLGGVECSIGNEAFPVIQHLTSSGQGGLGQLFTNPTGTNIFVSNSTLVDLNWELPAGGRPTGCGGSEYEKYIDTALEYALNNHFGQRPGMTVLKGSLFVGERTAVQAAAEKGEL